MALPMIAAGIAARAVAKKLATRAAGGIMGTGAKSVNPVYKMMDKQVTPLSKNVKLKPAAKQIGNPLNEEKAIQSMISSASRRGGKVVGTLGKNKDFRVANSKKINSKSNPQKIIEEAKLYRSRPTIKINSALPKRGK